ncbi:DASS family sodium-coupled anion symporter [Aeromicrobium halocynthiae]|uniref:Sodium-dependent dicarboxylate transporter SdcS n=1 Tax=Aeromicrobium halocynthiae TaxID=560557 RepID=A0ABP5HQX9_9ACTN
MTQPDRMTDEERETSEGMQATSDPPGTFRRRMIGLVAGPVLAVLLYLVLPDDLGHAGALTAAIAILMATWWMTEAIPIPATALIPLLAFPVLGDVSVDEVGASYGNNIIFLFMGGFMLALAMQRWNLHRRIALVTVRAMGTKPHMVIGGFMLATAFLSMWVSNTATAVMMLPIGLSVLMLVNRLSGEAEPDGASADEAKTGETTRALRTNFGTALMLGIAYAASIGSLGTIIGTPPNTLLVGYMSTAHDVQIGFGQWMLLGLPLAVVLLLACWFILTRLVFPAEMDDLPGGRELMDAEVAKLGPVTRPEKMVAAIFLLAAVSWVTFPLVQDEPVVSDAGIAMAIALLLFLLPAGTGRGIRLLDWEYAARLPWGVLLLFGGGLALSAQFSESGLTEWIGEKAEGFGGIPVVLLVVIVTAGVVMLTELTSNTATAATFLPLAGGLALGLGIDPLLLAIPVALAATCAFMLPVATPPNAIAFGSGYVSIGDMMRGGIWINLVALVAITAAVMTIAGAVFGISL